MVKSLGSQAFAITKRPRGERGGAKARRQKELREKTLAGEYIPKADYPETPNFGSQVGSYTSEVRRLPRAQPSERSELGEALKQSSEFPASAGESEHLPRASGSQSSSSRPVSQIATTVGSKRPIEESQSESEKASPLAARLSQPIGPVWKAGSFEKTESPSAPGQSVELRLSLDFHNVLDVEVAGARSYSSVISQENRRAIYEFICKSSRHRLSICSYIGHRGWQSQQRRSDLREEVKSVNRWLSSRGVSEEQLIRLLITSDPLKKELQREAVSLHCDDKQDILDSCAWSGVATVHFTKLASRYHRACTRISEVLEKSLQWVEPRIYSEKQLGELVL